MRDYVNVLRLQLRNMLRRDRTQSGSKKWIGAVVALVIAYAVIAAAFIALIVMMGEVFAAFDLAAEFVTLILLCALFMVLIFGIVTVLTCLYFSRDTEFFLALPLKPNVVFAAKLTVVYLVELAVSALLLVPCLIAAGVVLHASALFYVLLPVAVLLTPTVPLFLASVIAIPIMYVASFFRNRGALGSIAVIVLFGAFFALYYWGISKMQDIDPETVDLESIRHIFVRIANTAYPLYALARAMTGVPAFGMSAAESSVINLCIGIGCVLALGAIAMFISATVYRRGAASQLENTKRKAATEASFRASGATKALMKKEWREILRTPAFALNCLLGVVVCPIVVAFVGFSTNISSIANEVAAEGEALSQSAVDIISAIIRCVMLGMVLFMSVGTNSAPCTAFSREGEKFLYCKILPVSGKTQLRAKSYVYLIVGSVSSLLGVAVMAIMDFDVTFFLCSVALVLLYNFAAVHFGMWIDLRNPKLKWVTPNEAVKHNKNVMTSVLVSLLVPIVTMVAAGWAYVKVYGAAGAGLASLTMWSILFVVTIAAAAVSYVLLYRDCEEKIDAVQV